MELFYNARQWENLQFLLFWSYSGVTKYNATTSWDLYNEYNFVAAFAVSTLLAILALLTLVLKYILEWKAEKIKN